MTGEAVVLDIPCARFPSRIAAVLIDMTIQILLLIAVALGVVLSAGTLDGATAAGIFLGSYAAIVVGYSTIFETLTRGKTPGKMVFGLRVISDDGSPVRFRQALIRGLTGAIEIWSTVGAPIGLITSLLSAKGKRLGDMFAGTYVIQERAPHRPDLPLAFAVVPPPLLGWAQVAEISRLTDHNAEAAGSYLRRFHELSPAARDDLGLRLARAVAAQVGPPPPPGTPPAAFLAAVLAVRRERELARLAAQPGVTHPGMTQPVAPQPGVTHPGMTQPVAPQPGVTYPGIAQPGLAQPGVTQPGVAQPGANGAQVTGAAWPVTGPAGAWPVAGAWSPPGVVADDPARTVPPAADGDPAEQAGSGGAEPEPEPERPAPGGFAPPA